MVAFAEPRRPPRRAYAPQCVGSSSCANPLDQPLSCNDRNQQYSIIAITNGSAAIQERYAYTAYGAPTITDASGTPRTATTEGNRYTYTGREWDEELNLYHYRARMYDPEAGRFCSRDPMGFVDGFSVYMAYFVPRALDPSGLSWWGVIPGFGFTCEFSDPAGGSLGDYDAVLLGGLTCNEDTCGKPHFDQAVAVKQCEDKVKGIAAVHTAELIGYYAIHLGVDVLVAGAGLFAPPWGWIATGLSVVDLGFTLHCIKSQGDQITAASQAAIKAYCRCS